MRKWGVENCRNLPTASLWQSQGMNQVPLLTSGPTGCSRMREREKSKMNSKIFAWNMELTVVFTIKARNWGSGASWGYKGKNMNSVWDASLVVFLTWYFIRIFHKGTHPNSHSHSMCIHTWTCYTHSIHHSLETIVPLQANCFLFLKLNFLTF